MGTLKRLLSNVETELFRNWNDHIDANVQAVNIVLCNTSASPVDVFLSFVELSGVFINGSIFSSMEIPANETIYKEIPPRLMAVDSSIKAYASTADVIALSIDLLGVSQDLIPDDVS